MALEVYQITAMIVVVGVALVYFKYIITRYPPLRMVRTIYTISPAVVNHLRRLQYRSTMVHREMSGKIDLSDQEIVSIYVGGQNDSKMPSGCDVSYHTHYAKHGHEHDMLTMQDILGYKDFAIIAKYSALRKRPIVHLVATPNFTYVVMINSQLWNHIVTNKMTPWEVFHAIESQGQQIYLRMRSKLAIPSPATVREYNNSMIELGFVCEQYDKSTREIKFTVDYPF